MIAKNDRRLIPQTTRETSKLLTALNNVRCRNVRCNNVQLSELQIARKYLREDSDGILFLFLPKLLCRYVLNCHFLGASSFELKMRQMPRMQGVKMVREARYNVPTYRELFQRSMLLAHVSFGVLEITSQLLRFVV